MLDPRPLIAREPTIVAPRHRPLVALASVASLAALTGRVGASPVVVGAAGGCGGGDWLDEAQKRAEACLPPDQIRPAPGSPCDPPIRQVPVSGTNADALAAADPFEIQISLEADFKPEAIISNSGDIEVTTIKYGPSDKMIGQMIHGSAFLSTTQQQGYRLPHKRYLRPGQTITIAGTARAAFAANALALTVYGFTPAD